MAGMFPSGSAWFGLAVGAALLVECTAFFVFRHRPGSARRRPRGSQSPMLLCMGVMLTSGSAARLCGWTGVGMRTVFLIGMVAAVATAVFAIRSLVSRASAQSRTILPSQPE